MKKILLPMFIFISAANAFCGQRFDAATWRTVQTYDIAGLKKIVETQVGKIVAVRFNYRSKRLRHIKPNWFEASIWEHNPQEKSGYSYLPVFVSKKNLPSFQSIPTDFKSTAVLTVYGQVQKDADANYLFFHLLGRRATLDAAGNAVVDW
jgi:hypothetical protein